MIGTNSSASGPGPTGTNTANPTDFPAFTTPFPTGTSSPRSGDSPKKSSKTAAIIGGAVGGAVVIAIAVVIIGLLSRRQRPTPTPGPYMADVASQPLYDAQKPMSDVGTTAPPSTVETPVMPAMPMRVYVCIFRTSTGFMLIDFCTPRIRMMQLRSPGTRNLSTYLTRLPSPLSNRTCLPNLLSNRTLHLETPWPACRPQCQMDIVACRLSDFCLVLLFTRLRIRVCQEVNLFGQPGRCPPGQSIIFVMNQQYILYVIPLLHQFLVA